MKSSVKSFSILLLLIGSIFSFSACNKNKDNPNPAGEYYLKCSLNGKSLFIDHAVWNAGEFEKQMDNVNGEKVYSYGVGAAESDGEGVTLGFCSKTKLTAPATFTETKDAPFGSHLSAVLMYQKNIIDENIYNSINFYDLVPHIMPLYPNVERNVTITITEFNGTYIKGTFSGIVYPYNDDFEPVINKKIEITNGEFKLKLP